VLRLLERLGRPGSRFCNRKKAHQELALLAYRLQVEPSLPREGHQHTSSRISTGCLRILDYGPRWWSAGCLQV